MNREPSGAALDAYRHAWRARKQTGDASDEVLLAALRERDAPAAFYTPAAPEYEVLFGCWRRGVRPRWLPVAGFSQVLQQSAAPWLEVFSDREDSLAWMDLPEGKSALSEERAGPVALCRLQFHRADDAADALSDCRDAPVDESGWHRALVWLQMDGAEPVADVMVGEVRIGWTSLPGDDWLRMREAAEHGLYADGVLQVGRMHNGAQAVGDLHCHLIT